MSTLICPFCQSELNAGEHRTYICENNHNFDLAKEGYLNLLPVNQKKSKEPGDNEMMISARREFLELGHYNPMIESLIELIDSDLKFETEDITILDSGCGEGYYSEQALSKIANAKPTIFGTDISKFAVKSAAKKYKNNFYFVSSVYNLPIADQSIDLILSIFAPIHPEEFSRILKDKGYVIVVSPDKEHLKGLAELIYNEFRPHGNNIIENMSSHFENIGIKRSTFKLDIKDADSLLKLLKMTPYYWNTSEEKFAKMSQSTDFNIGCDFNITVFKKNEEFKS